MNDRNVAQSAQMTGRLDRQQPLRSRLSFAEGERPQPVFNCLSIESASLQRHDLGAADERTHGMRHQTDLHSSRGSST